MAIVGFSWGGWVTGHTAESTASDRASTAVVAALAPICAERFKSAENSATNMTALTKLDSWSRGDYVEKGGWSTWPGKTDPAQITAVAKACATLLTA
jgi:hypothetical protein